MKNVILIVLIMFSTNLMSQKFDVPDGFDYNSEYKSYFKAVKTKKEAVSECLDVFEFYGLNSLDLIVSNESRIIVFKSIDSKKKNHMIVLYAIHFDGMYDISLNEIKNQDRVMFSFEDYDGKRYLLKYFKQ
tara:strand:- start:597 stop:989 length:393 start_codon:yes stop_codon:yes gene_type:complete